MKTKVRVNMHDAFSGCTDSRELSVPSDKLKVLEYAQAHEQVIPEFSNNIRYEWIIDEVEIL